MPCDTKERIAQVAVALFSDHGFDAVSIRDISRAAGIKESTIYYHYANKQAILDALFSRADSIAAQKQVHFDAALAQAADVSTAEMVFVAEHLLDDYFLHPVIFPLIRMLEIERIHDAAAEARYQQIVFVLPLLQQTKVFAQMTERQMLRPCDPQAVSTIYHGVIYSAFAQYCLGKTRSPESLEAAHSHIRSGILALYEMIRS